MARGRWHAADGTRSLSRDHGPCAEASHSSRVRERECGTETRPRPEDERWKRRARGDGSGSLLFSGECLICILSATAGMSVVRVAFGPVVGGRLAASLEVPPPRRPPSAGQREPVLVYVRCVTRDTNRTDYALHELTRLRRRAAMADAWMRGAGCCQRTCLICRHGPVHVTRENTLETNERNMNEWIMIPPQPGPRQALRPPPERPAR